jgi:Abnormal spindle-like microcephaly-assoc'd, ASPM-SPD-2-Hydin
MIKISSLICGAWIAASLTSFAITPDDILSDALVGKTLTFQIETGNGELPDSGSWTGEFMTEPANGFKITNGSGNGGVYTTSRSLESENPGVTIINLKSFFGTNSQNYLVLQVANGIATYSLTVLEIKIPVTNSTQSNQTGTFTIGGGGSVAVSEIEIQQPAGSILLDNKGSRSFGTKKVGKKSTEKVFKIFNRGEAALSRISVSVTGKHKADFIVGKPKKTTLAKGEDTTFTVVFKPGKKGTRKATLKVGSNDVDENPFEIEVAGMGAK